MALNYVRLPSLDPENLDEIELALGPRFQPPEPQDFGLTQPMSPFGGLQDMLLSLAMARGGGGSYSSGGSNYSGRSYPNGDAPPGRGIFFNNSVDVLQPNDPRLVTRYGVTLARPAMRSLVDIFGNRDVDLGGGYRSPSAQASVYANKPGLAAPPGSSYHQEGLAIDLAAALQKARIERQLAQAGWNRFSPSGEPWHWSYGVTG